MTKPLVIVTKCPPSLNNAYPTRKNGGRYKSKKLVEWLDQFYLDVREQNIGYVNGPFRTAIETERPHHAMDLDNIVKACLDGLQKADIIHNDNLNWGLNVSWVLEQNAPKKGDRCTIIVEALS